MGTSDRMHTTLLEVHNANRKQGVLYWFQPAGRWPTANAAEQLLLLLDALSGRPQYAFVRISSPIGMETEAERDLVEFASELAPSIRAVVEELY